jgi:F420-non-reducing hydrogenase iron-sulfur subunit
MTSETTTPTTAAPEVATPAPAANPARTDPEAAPTAATTKASLDWQPEIIAFCCNYCAYAAADLAGSRRMQYPTNVRIIHVPCTGKLEMESILDAFLKGIDGILVAGCLEGGCHFLEGNLRARKRTDRIREMLAEIGVGEERLNMVNLSAAMAPTFVESVKNMVDTVRSLGPSPLRDPRPPESEGKL